MLRDAAQVKQLSFSQQFSIARIVRSNICLQQQKKPLFPQVCVLFFFSPARPHNKQEAPFIDQHKVPNKWAPNESRAPGSPEEAAAP